MELLKLFLLGNNFIGRDSVCLVLGDNIFFGNGLSEELKKASAQKTGATVFGYYVQNPQRYGVLEFDENNKVISLEEKPKIHKSNSADENLLYPSIPFFASATS